MDVLMQQRVERRTREILSAADEAELLKRLGAHESDRVITVRLPAVLHSALKDQAHAQRLSLNQLCVNRVAHVPEPETDQTPLEAAARLRAEREVLYGLAPADVAEPAPAA